MRIDTFSVQIKKRAVQKVRIMYVHTCAREIPVRERVGLGDPKISVYGFGHFSAQPLINEK